MPKKKITKDQFKDIFVEWMTRLHLLHWHFDFDLEWEPQEEDGEDIERDAEIKIAKDYSRAKLCLNKAWPTWSIEQLERVIAHELIHCVVERVWQVATCDQVEDALSDRQWEFYEERLLHELESAVDALAHALATSWPESAAAAAI